MIGIHQSVARKRRLAAVMRVAMVAGCFVALAGVGIGAGIVQARKNAPVAPRTLKVKTSSQTDAIPPPTYNNSAAGVTTDTVSEAQVEGAETTTPSTTTTTPKASSGTIIIHTDPAPTTPADPTPVPDPPSDEHPAPTGEETPPPPENP